jgi:hypothetical protein
MCVVFFFPDGEVGVVQITGQFEILAYHDGQRRKQSEFKGVIA